MVGETKDMKCMITNTFIHKGQKTGREMTVWIKSGTVSHGGKTIQTQQTCNKTVRNNSQGWNEKVSIKG